MSEYKLVDVLELKYGKDHKTLSDGNIPVYGSGGIMRYADTFLYNKESILIPRKGTLNNIFYLNGEQSFWTVDTIFWSKINTELAFGKFLFYYLLTIDFANLNVGSAVPSLTTKVLNEVNISLPPLKEQKAIAEILSSLDDKIDLLHRQNKTLEELAQTLFRQWFIEQANDEWKTLELGSFISTVDNRGKTPPNQKEETAHPLIEVNALGKSDRLVDYSVIRKYVNKETFETWFRNTPSKYDTLVSTVGSIGAFSMFILERGNIAQNVIALHPEDISPFYLYQVLKYKKNEIMQLDIGGVQPSIKVPHLLSIAIPNPDKATQAKFDNHIIKYVDKMELNYNQIKTLKSMRDTLLPKLMSWEVRVTNG